MEADEIIDGLEDFFNNLSPEEFEEIREAFSVEIEGDVSIDEYLSNFCDLYFYTSDCDSSCYESEVIDFDPIADLFVNGKFDATKLEFSIEFSENSIYKVSDIKEVKKAA